MATITNGEISYERSVKVADYENKKLGAKFSYVLEDKDDPEQVHLLFRRQIIRFVEDGLGIKPTELAAAETRGPPRALSQGEPAAPVTAATPVVANTAPEDTPKPKGKPGRPKGSGKKAEPKDVPADEPEVREAKFQEMVKNTPDPEPGDEIDSPAFSGAPAISDADLGQAARRAAERVGGAAKVKDFIQTFFNAPCPTGVWKAHQVPAAQRAEFIKQLEALE